MTTDRCAHGELLATWCDDCAIDFLARTGPDPVAWTWTRKERRMQPADIVLLSLLSIALAACGGWLLGRYHR